MPNLDILYDVIMGVTYTQDETNTNKEVIYQPTCLPSFVTLDGFYFCLWPRTHSFGRIGRKCPSNRPPCIHVCKDILTSENICLIDALWSRGSFAPIQKPLVTYALKSSNFEFAAATETQHVLFHPIFNHVGQQTRCTDRIFGGFFLSLLLNRS